MTDQQHPITPPTELVAQWYDAIDNSSTSWKQELTTKAARWGADQELEACCEWVSQWCGRWLDGTRPEDELRTARRSKPPSLAEQALKALQNQIDTSFKISSEAQERADTIRAALERLQELENGNE